MIPGLRRAESAAHDLTIVVIEGEAGIVGGRSSKGIEQLSSGLLQLRPVVVKSLESKRDGSLFDLPRLGPPVLHLILRLLNCLSLKDLQLRRH